MFRFKQILQRWILFALLLFSLASTLSINPSLMGGSDLATEKVPESVARTADPAFSIGLNKGKPEATTGTPTAPVAPAAPAAPATPAAVGTPAPAPAAAAAVEKPKIEIADGRELRITTELEASGEPVPLFIKRTGDTCRVQTYNDTGAEGRICETCDRDLKRTILKDQECDVATLLAAASSEIDYLLRVRPDDDRDLDEDDRERRRRDRYDDFDLANDDFELDEDNLSDSKARRELDKITRACQRKNDAAMSRCYVQKFLSATKCSSDRKSNCRIPEDMAKNYFMEKIRPVLKADISQIRDTGRRSEAVNLISTLQGSLGSNYSDLRGYLTNMSVESLMAAAQGTKNYYMQYDQLAKQNSPLAAAAFQRYQLAMGVLNSTYTELGQANLFGLQAGARNGFISDFDVQNMYQNGYVAVTEPVVTGLGANPLTYQIPQLAVTNPTIGNTFQPQTALQTQVVAPNGTVTQAQQQQPVTQVAGAKTMVVNGQTGVNVRNFAITPGTAIPVTGMSLQDNNTAPTRGILLGPGSLVQGRRQ